MDWIIQQLVKMGFMELLSIQSSVVFGHVGNSVVIFLLQWLGIEAWVVNMVYFFNYTGYGEWRGLLLSADDLCAVICGVEERGVLGCLAVVLSGYQGAEDVGAVVLDTVARVKELNSAAIYCCDLVMGDVGRGMFVCFGIFELMRDRVVFVVDVIISNHFELDFLAGRSMRTVFDLLAVVDDVRAGGFSIVLVISVLTDEIPEGLVDVVVVSEGGAWSCRMLLLPIMLNGCGDVTVAVFLAHLLCIGLVETALQ